MRKLGRLKHMLVPGLVVALPLLGPGCGRGSRPEKGAPLPGSTSPAAHNQSSSSGPDSETQIRFEDVARAAGITFQSGHGGRTPLNILETAGHGCAFLDVDSDGWLDILLVGQPRCAVYRNKTRTPGGELRFEEVPDAAGLAVEAYWMGCATGDYDNDGRTDLLLTGYRRTALFRNEGSKFREVTAAVPLDPAAWSTSAVFFDADRDGMLDLYVGAYVKFGPTSLQLCDFEGVKAACPPTYYDPEFGRFYRNLGGGHFADQTRVAGLDASHGKTLGVAAADFDGDGWTDLYLANDGMPGDLMRNQRGRFRNIGTESGTAFNHASREQAGMGVDWGDYDGDGRLDLVVTTFQYEPTSLYRNRGSRLFEEEAFAAGVGDPSLNRLGFGARFLDADNDGDLDLITANGHVQDNVHLITPGSAYAQPTQLFENRGNGRFADISAAAGAALTQPVVGRGLATGDLDNDGDLDILIANLEGAPLLLRNETPRPASSVRLRLIGRSSARDGAGTRVTLQAGGRTQIREAGTSGSYLSAGDPRVHFGVGSVSTIDTLTLRWPSGVVQQLRRLPAGKELTITESAPEPARGKGKPVGH